MDIVVNSIDTVSLIAILIMIVTLFVGYIRKYSMTYMIVIANFIVFVLTFITLENFEYFIGPITKDLAFRPIYLSLENSPQLYTIFTSMFVHGGPFHLLGNMLVFFFIGSALEQRIGFKKFLIIYLLSGICGTIAHSVLNIGSYTGLVGASGAIFGVMGALAYSYPHDKILMPIPLGCMMVIRRIKVIYAVVFFAVLETVIVLFEVQDNTAHFAHFGGLIGGFILAALLLKKQKKHTKLGETIYYDSYTPQKLSETNFSELRKLATTRELKEMLNKIENETVPQVRDVWLEHFFDKVICPKCSNPLHHLDSKVWCEYCGFRTQY